jgi:hypothetical protein
MLQDSTVNPTVKPFYEKLTDIYHNLDEPLTVDEYNEYQLTIQWLEGYCAGARISPTPAANPSVDLKPPSVLQASRSNISFQDFLKEVNVQVDAELSNKINLSEQVLELQSRLKARDAYLRATIADTAKTVQDMRRTITDLNYEKSELADQLTSIIAEYNDLEFSIKSNLPIDLSRKDPVLIPKTSMQTQTASPTAASSNKFDEYEDNFSNTDDLSTFIQELNISFLK